MTDEERAQLRRNRVVELVIDAHEVAAGEAELLRALRIVLSNAGCYRLAVTIGRLEKIEAMVDAAEPWIGSLASESIARSVLDEAEGTYLTIIELHDAACRAVHHRMTSFALRHKDVRDLEDEDVAGIAEAMTAAWAGAGGTT